MPNRLIYKIDDGSDMNLELKESEDEKIRKHLLKHFRNKTKEQWNGMPTKNIVVWLEKKAEQKPIDKVEPKFHEGDIIIHKELGGDYIHNSHKIIQVDILDKKYRLEGGLVAHFSEQDDYELVEQKPAWSEEDEKQAKQIVRIACDNGCTHKLQKQIANWLKSIKERIKGE